MKRINGQYLDPVERQFKARGKHFTLEIVPARICIGKDRNGHKKYKDFFPGAREEFVEDALRKIAWEKGGILLDGRIGITFTFRELQKELKSHGHTYNIAQIKQSILICRSCELRLKKHTGSGQTTIEEGIFPFIGLHEREEWKHKKGNSHCYVQFNLWVNQALKQKNFRPTNYKLNMSIKNGVARWLAKKMSHNFTQSGTLNRHQQEYKILLSTIIAGAGIPSNIKIKDCLREVFKAINELKEKFVISKCNEERIKAGRRLIDVKFILTGGYKLTKDMKKFNTIMNSSATFTKGKKSYLHSLNHGMPIKIRK